MEYHSTYCTERESEKMSIVCLCSLRINLNHLLFINLLNHILLRLQSPKSHRNYVRSGSFLTPFILQCGSSKIYGQRSFISGVLLKESSTPFR